MKNLITNCVAVKNLVINHVAKQINLVPFLFKQNGFNTPLLAATHFVT